MMLVKMQKKRSKALSTKRSAHGSVRTYYDYNENDGGNDNSNDQ